MDKIDVESGYKLIEDWLDAASADDYYARILEEVSFSSMYSHGNEVPRLVAVQYAPCLGADVPIYRHPSDASPLAVPTTPCIASLMEGINERLGTRLNHVLIQWYRDGRDCISQHSDKTIDVLRDSIIVNASFGAERILTLRPKREKAILNQGDGVVDGEDKGNTRVVLGHGSLFLLSLPLNASSTHAIKANKKAERDKSAEELRFNGSRISLTLREIGTFLTPRGEIYGVGATGKMKCQAKPVDASDEAWSDLLVGFARENRGRVVDVHGYYSRGSDAYR